MTAVLAFDVYGTLIDTAGVVAQLRESVGDQAERFSSVWRDKQLEYSFRRGLMQRYENFAVCTRDALEYTCASMNAALSQQQRNALLDAYSVLPAFDDVGPSLAGLRARGIALYAFSNGTAKAVEALLDNAGIRGYFADVVSCDEIETFKPNPAVYRHFLSRSGAEAASAWLVSGNPFDVIGAISAGMRGVWVKRSAAAIFDPWGIVPTTTVTDLREIDDHLAA